MFMTEEKLPYKVETKHNLWRVFLERGTYSDYENETLIFSGNSAEEIWQRLKEYTKCFDEIVYKKNECDNHNRNNYLRIDSDFGKIRNKFFENDNYWDVWSCEITPLDIIYFTK